MGRNLGYADICHETRKPKIEVASRSWATIKGVIRSFATASHLPILKQMASFTHNRTHLLLPPGYLWRPQRYYC